MTDEPVEIAWQGKWLQMNRRGRWEYVSRVGGMHATVIVAIDDSGHVLLIDQYRVPLGRRCIELPAGIVGDEQAGEAVETAARRELEEETGYRAARIDVIGDFHSSPGMVSEGFTLVRAHGITRVGAGGGTEVEDIVVHRVPLAEVPAFVRAKRAEGAAVDVKLLLLLAQSLIG